MKKKYITNTTNTITPSHDEAADEINFKIEEIEFILKYINNNLPPEHKRLLHGQVIALKRQLNNDDTITEINQWTYHVRSQTKQKASDGSTILQYNVRLVDNETQRFECSCHDFQQNHCGLSDEKYTDLILANMPVNLCCKHIFAVVQYRESKHANMEALL